MDIFFQSYSNNISCNNHWFVFIKHTCFSNQIKTISPVKKNITSNADLSSLTTFISGGDTLSPAKNEEGVKFLQEHNSNAKIYNGSGSAETVGANTNAIGQPIKLDTVGRILTGSDCIIIDAEKFNNEGIITEIVRMTKAIIGKYVQEELKLNNITHHVEYFEE